MKRNICAVRRLGNRLAARNRPFVVVNPPELRAELLWLAEWISGSATSSS
jgi:hypothetical protein